MQVAVCSDLRLVNTPHGAVHVPCGECPACIALKGLRRKNNLDMAISDFPNRFFITLTYDDAHLPLARFDEASSSFVSDRDCDYNGVCYSFDSSLVCKDSVSFSASSVSIARYGGIPVLSRRDIILFKKRLRKLLKKFYPDEQVYFYITGEYGPSTYRPHYHFIFGCKSLLSLDTVISLVRSAWSYRYKTSNTSVRGELGFINVQQITYDSCSRYVTQYVNSVADLPYYLRKTVFRQFVQHSSDCDGRLRAMRVEPERFFDSPSFEFSYPSPKDNSLVTASVPSFLEDRYFPRHKGYYLVSDEVRVRIAEFVQQFPNYREFRDYIINKPIDDGGLAYHFVSDVVCRGFSSYDIVFGSTLYKFYNTFRRYVSVARSHSMSLLSYFRKVTKYHLDKGLYRLNKFLRYLENYSVSHPLSAVYAWYYDTVATPSEASYVFSDYRQLTSYKDFHSLMASILSNTTKTKKRNDYFVLKGLTRSNYVSTSRLNQFYKVF